MGWGWGAKVQKNKNKEARMFYFKLGDQNRRSSKTKGSKVQLNLLFNIYILRVKPI
jgi:hypothetical protein